MKSDLYADYNGMPCIRREIDASDWTWTYIYQNKDASKNVSKKETLNKSYNSLNEKYKKNEELIRDNGTKFLRLIKSDSFDNIDINSNEWDCIKGVKTARNRYIKATNANNEIKDKMSSIKEELKIIEDCGFEEFVKVKTKEMVYAYDMRNYVRLHPEEFNNKK